MVKTPAPIEVGFLIHFAEREKESVSFGWLVNRVVYFVGQESPLKNMIHLSPFSCHPAVVVQRNDGEPKCLDWASWSSKTWDPKSQPFPTSHFQRNRESDG